MIEPQSQIDALYTGVIIGSSIFSFISIITGIRVIYLGIRTLPFSAYTGAFLSVGCGFFYIVLTAVWWYNKGWYDFTLWNGLMWMLYHTGTAIYTINYHYMLDQKIRRFAKNSNTRQ